MHKITFQDDEDAEICMSSNDGTRDFAVLVALLDKLVLMDIDLEDSTTATNNFANLVARIRVSELELSSLL